MRFTTLVLAAGSSALSFAAPVAENHQAQPGAPFGVENQQARPGAPNGVKLASPSSTIIPSSTTSGITATSTANSSASGTSSSKLQWLGANESGMMKILKHEGTQLKVC